MKEAAGVAAFLVVYLLVAVFAVCQFQIVTRANGLYPKPDTFHWRAGWECTRGVFRDYWQYVVPAEGTHRESPAAPPVQ